MQCISCTHKKVSGISASRASGRSPLSDEERADIKAGYGFCDREHCKRVCQQVANYPPGFKEEYDAIFADYFALMDGYYSVAKTIERPEFCVRRSALKQQFTELRNAVDKYRADVAAAKCKKRKRVFREPDADAIASHMQLLVNNYIRHIRALNADYKLAKDYWCSVLGLPEALFETKIIQDPLCEMDAEEFALYF